MSLLFQPNHQITKPHNEFYIPASVGKMGIKISWPCWILAVEGGWLAGWLPRPTAHPTHTPPPTHTQCLRICSLGYAISQFQKKGKVQKRHRYIKIFVWLILSCVDLNKLFNLSHFSFVICKIEMIITTVAIS